MTFLRAVRRRFNARWALAAAAFLLLSTLTLWRWRAHICSCSTSTPAAIPDPVKHCTVMNEDLSGSNFIVGQLRTAKGPVSIALFGPDDVISQAILNSGTWEPQILDGLEKMFLLDPSLHLIDIGANLGVYSLLAARYGRRVIAVDANRSLVERLRRSVQLNGFQSLVKTVWNAVSNSRLSHRLISPDENNIGHSWLGPSDAVQGGPLVSAVLADDLLELIDFRRAVLKIDIEGHEPLALKGAARLFATVDIAAVFMEWQWVAQEQSDSPGQDIMRFLRSRGYAAFPQPLSDVPLDYSEFRRWPADVVWKKL